MNRAFFTPLTPILIAQTTLTADLATAAMDAAFKLFHPDSTATCFFVRREAAPPRFISSRRVTKDAALSYGAS